MSHKRILDLAYDMASYIHHIGYPVYDGGHSEPEEECQDPDCKAVREFRNELQADYRRMDSSKE